MDPSNPKAIANSLFSSNPHNEVYKRLIDIFRPRGHDYYLMNGPEPSWILEYRCKEEDFDAYIDECSTKAILPSWLDAAATSDCRKLALDPVQDWYIGHAIDDEDIEQRYHGASTVEQMRALAAHIYDHAYEYETQPDLLGAIIS